VPIHDFAIANEELTDKTTEIFYPCCGKSICAGCNYSFDMSGNEDKCPFCASDRSSKTDEEQVEQLMKRVEANDAASICLLANSYHYGRVGLQPMELFASTAELGFSKAHRCLGDVYDEGEDLKKAKFHFEAAAWLDTTSQEATLH
jgi:hypothetical protein